MVNGFQIFSIISSMIDNSMIIQIDNLIDNSMDLCVDINHSVVDLSTISAVSW